MTLSFVRDSVQICAYAIGALAALFSIYQYKRNSRRERARWLFELYERFYERAELKEMRQLIEEGKTDFAAQENDLQKLQRLDDYLNFFEFIAFLRRKKELNTADVRDMFDYPLRKMADDEAVRGYIEKQTYGYEGVREILRELDYSKS